MRSPRRTLLRSTLGVVAAVCAALLASCNALVVGAGCTDDDCPAGTSCALDGSCVVIGAAPLLDAGARSNDGGAAMDDGGAAVDDGGAAVDDGGAGLDGGAAVDDGGAAIGDGGAGTGDAGAGADDGGTGVDGGAQPVDAGPADAGPPDAGPVDAGPPDAGPPYDAGPCGDEVFDDFEDQGPLTDTWEDVESDFGVGIGKQGGALVLEFASDTYLGEGARVVQSVARFLERRVAVEVVQTPDASGAYLALRVRGANGDWQEIWVKGDQIAFWSGEALYLSFPYDPLAHRFWMIQAFGGETRAWVSPDGADWTQLGPTKSTPESFADARVVIEASTTAFHTANGGEGRVEQVILGRVCEED